jgi:hypothetical protein
MTPVQIEILAEIRRLINEAYDHYFAIGDCHCKSSEGAIEIYYPNYFDIRDGKADPLAAKGLGIYSYVLGPSRMHTWLPKTPGITGNRVDRRCDDPFAAVLEDVRRWHAEEMADTHEDD